MTCFSNQLPCRVRRFIPVVLGKLGIAGFTPGMTIYYWLVNVSRCLLSIPNLFTLAYREPLTANHATIVPVAVQFSSPSALSHNWRTPHICIRYCICRTLSCIRDEAISHYLPPFKFCIHRCPFLCRSCIDLCEFGRLLSSAGYGACCTV